MKTVRIVIAVIASVGLASLLINFLITGNDIPAGILYMLSIIFGAVFTPEAIEAVKRTGGSSDPPKSPTPPSPPSVPISPTPPTGSRKES